MASDTYMVVREVLKRVRSAAHSFLLVASLTYIGAYSCFAADVTLAWDPSPDAHVAGYKVYFGTASRTYSQVLDAGNTTTLTISNLTSGVTYYFAATAYDSWGLESDYSAETSYTVPLPWANQPPTLDPIANISIPEDSPPVAVAIAGISDGEPNGDQSLTVAATSSNPGLIPSPTVSYTSPGATGTLTLRPVPTKSGTAIITVTVNDGAASNSNVSRVFTVTVTPVNDSPTINSPANISLNENAGVQTVTLTGISSGATNEAQSLSIAAVSSNPTLIPHPTVTYSSPASTASLRFTPSSGTGIATITVTVSDGAMENSSKSVTFQVAVNALPSISDLPHRAIALGSNLPPVGFAIWDAETPAAGLVVTASSSNPQLVPNSNIFLGGSGTNRTIAINPVANKIGTATITVTVSDGLGSASDTFQISVQQRPVAPGNLRLMIEGQGYVTPSLSTALVVGQIYTVTAIPQPGQEFAGWSGAVESSSSRISFIASADTALKARFVPSPFLPTKGLYSGLFQEADAVRQHSSGFFALQSNARGKYSGYLQIGLTRYPFSGKLSLQCTATNLIRLKDGKSLTLGLSVATDGSDSISGTVSDGSWTASLTGDRATFHPRTNKAAWAGHYTMVLPGQDADALLPLGDSYGTVKISSSGVAIWAGKLADGTSFARTARLSKSGAIPLYVPLYRGAGSVIAWVMMEDRSSDDFHGEANWIRPANDATYVYSAGFSYSNLIVGSRYTFDRSSPILALANGTVYFQTEDREFSNPVELGITGLVKNLGLNSMTLRIVPGNGTFKGTVIDPETRTKTPFGGAVLQKQNAGFGHFKAGSAFGRVTVY